MLPAHLQLALPFAHEATYDTRDFLPAASNREALAWLQRTAGWPERRLALTGPAGCGKSHLLHAWAERTGAVCLSGPLLCDLNGLPESGAVALDDADTVASDVLLLHALNTARDRGLFVLMSGRTPPARWPIRLADLGSRLRAVTLVEIQPPDDDLLRALLVRLLADRQLAVPQAVQDWMLLRLPRSPAAMREAVARLDRVSLAWGKPITRSLAAEILACESIGAMDIDENEVPVADPNPCPHTIRLL